MNIVDSDYLVVGSGMAGLMSALHLASYGRVIVVTKGLLADCNTNFAQGGICCVMDPADTFDRHARDTMIAGAWLGKTEVVHEICEHAPEGIRDLVDCGVRFARREDGSWDLTREGGHSARRILHAGDITGEKCEAAMIRKVRRVAAATGRRGSGIDVREQTIVIDLVMSRRIGLPGENRCLGAYVLDKASGEIYAVRAPNTILATGGCGKVYLYTCNPDTATGDGVAIAWRAGAKIENMEFIQFHPTCLYHPQAKRFLISEAVRGEGAVLVNRHGREFMKKYDPRGSLAPRDIVARSIDSEMKRTGDDCVFLDIRSKGRTYLMKRFPNIYRTCLEFGIDMATDLIPVVPAAHYACGGIQATTDGRTSVRGLSAVGECACTGLHGANRLASNSLMEALVCARLTAARLGPRPESWPMRGGRPRMPEIPAWKTGSAVPPDEAVLVSHMWDEIRRLMWDYVGIVRTNKRLARAARRLKTLRREIRDYYFRYLVTPDTLELRNLAVCAELIVKSAQRRHESRGLHYTLNYPRMANRPRQTVLAGFNG
ncbi:MAG: L-aspartate oxidase [Kiritimatiellae bacterium]|nr:L-aspartate oxidase [Kiritimatiellia bacterium]MBQ3344776.1 L-aspartate oxidase [Kiritimatiellia bacterium]MBQ6329678.1 L-aspartate oxidase [Kiritimatiellia bacterium]